jgi:Zn-dependent membrane protease YugP
MVDQLLQLLFLRTNAVTQYNMIHPMLCCNCVLKLFPVVKIASLAQQFLLVFAFMLANTFPTLLLITIIAFMITTLFSLITLPVEFDASRRALAWLDETGVAKSQEYEGAKDALKWAAMTYVAAALSSLVMLIFLILRYMSSDRD